MEKSNRTSSNSKNEPEDRIGPLPDHLLSAILSYLPMKEVGRTNVLSKRWKNLCAGTRLYFDVSRTLWHITDHAESIERNTDKRLKHAMEMGRERRKYLKWVNKWTENHRGSDLSELVIVHPLDASDSCHLDKWIAFALRKRVKAIKIDLDPLFAVAARFEGYYSFIESATRIPGIECLTSLSLSNVNITGEMIEQLLSVCPLLERLSLEESRQISNLRIVGSSLKLKHLDIVLCYSLESIEICTPNLVSFHYHRVFGKRTILAVEGLCSLVDLHIYGPDKSYELKQFSSYFPQLATLSLDISYEEIKVLTSGVAQFTNLRHLTFKIIDFLGLYLSVFPKFISLTCPFLLKFALKMPEMPDLDWDIEEIGWDSEDVESDMDMEDEAVDVDQWEEQGRPRHERLKEVEIFGFSGKRDDVDIAYFFLRFAINLEKLVIDCRSQYSLSLEGIGKETRPGSREQAELLRPEAPPGLELIIL